MSKEITVVYSASNKTIYVVVFNKNGLVWNGVSFEIWNDSNIQAYAIGGDNNSYLTDTGGGFYYGDFPTNITTEGKYIIKSFMQIDLSPQINDIYLGSGKILWDGTKEVFGFEGDDINIAKLIRGPEGTTLDQINTNVEDVDTQINGRPTIQD